MSESAVDRLNLLFPVETINRELDCRLFLAVLCANPRNRIFVGQHDAIYRLSRHAEGGVYVGKHIFRDRFPIETGARYREFKSRGYSLVFIDEEGAIYYGGPREWEHGLRRRLDVGYLDSEDYVCTWGDFQRDYLRSLKPKCHDNIHNTGHPRFDLYEPQYRPYFQPDLDELAQYGKFILINTSLSLPNSGLGMKDTFSQSWGYYRSDPVIRTRFIETFAHYSRILLNFVELINRLSIEFPDLNFVIRPHPSEDQQYYRNVFGGIRNVHVIHQGAVPAWLFACRAMIHDGCTTGVEAHLAGTNLINFKSIENQRYDIFLPNVFGTKCVDQDEVFTALRKVRDGGTLPSASVNQDARSLFSNLERSALPRLMPVIAACQERVLGSGRAFTFRKRDFQLREAGQRAEQAARTVARSLFPEKVRKYRIYSSMFYGFKREDIAGKIARISALLNRQVEWELLNSEMVQIWR